MCMLVGGGARNNHLAFLKAQVLQSLPYVSTGALGFQHPILFIIGDFQGGSCLRSRRKTLAQS